ncbi:hypothetical protein [Hyalangium versicolor]|uniref:hypothetical protein n=1 Tax=Hyalangium versicolor TaxID=2861190 RepID=UPI001CCFB246|nr:hypothetical protein [Hyalangium versicolor]
MTALIEANDLCSHFMKPHELLLALLTIASPVSFARADEPPYFCESGDRGRDARDIAWNSDEWRTIQGAVLRYCARATGDEKGHCQHVVPLLKNAHCGFEFNPATDRFPANVAMGGASDNEAIVWYAQLERAGGKWKVLKIFFDDLERP